MPELDPALSRQRDRRTLLAVLPPADQTDHPSAGGQEGKLIEKHVTDGVVDDHCAEAGARPSSCRISKVERSRKHQECGVRSGEILDPVSSRTITGATRGLL